MKPIRIFLITLFSILSLVYAQKGVISINTDERLIQDSTNRTVIFHGINVVYKVPPYIPQNNTFDGELSLTDSEIDDLVRWGFNLVRLGVMWEAVERVEGQYNDTYLSQITDLINKLGEKGIYTLIDGHQDVFGRRTCGEGYPTFIVPDETLEHECKGILIPWVYYLFGQCKSMAEYNFTLDQDGYPAIDECIQNNFAVYYTAPETASSFERLYKNIDGVQDKFINGYWNKLSQTFANNEYVIGYDPINEPFPANIYEDIELVDVVGKFDKELLQPIYKRAFDTYQKHDKSKTMFFECAQFPDEVGVLGGIVFNLGFTEAPGGQDHANRQVLNDHTYCCQISADMCPTGEAPASKSQECLEWHKQRIETRSYDASRYGVPLFISEFGGCLNGTNCVVEIKNVADVCDQNLVGWAYWQFKNFKDFTTGAGQVTSEGLYNFDGTLQKNKVRALARTYMPVVQGIHKNMTFDSRNGNFVGIYQVDTSINEPTVLFMSDEFYYQGKQIQINVFDSDGTQITDLAVIYTIKPNYNAIKINDQKFNKHLITIRVVSTSESSLDLEQFDQ